MNSRYAERLTPREQEVIELLSTGCTNEEIARQLGISLDGVKYHVSGIFRHLKVKNRREAASLHLGTEGGVLTPRELEVIELLSAGLTNEEIARQLGISLDGVKYHVSGILRRLDVESRHDAASLHLRTERNGRLAALVPVMFFRKLPFGWLGKAAAGAALTVTAAGIALLAWGVISTSSTAVTPTGCSVEQTVSGAPNCAPSVVQAAAGADAITAISVGRFQTCALKDGGVWCWGGDSPSVPVEVSGLASGVSAINSDVVSCALKAGGVWCWGFDPATFGAGGDWSDVPVAVSGLARRVSAISGSCAIKDGGVWCWDLGNHPATWSAVVVSGLTSGVSAISAGTDHSCALKGGGVWCWGSNYNGQLGNNSTTDSPVPVAVLGLASGVSAISAGGADSCAVKGGGVWCWGWNPYYPELENNSTTGSDVPVAVSALGSGVGAISGGCAIKDGGVWCRGNNDRGQLGNNSTANSPVPVAVSELASGVSAISTGGDHSCALKDGGVWCWGRNDLGELGNASTTDSPVPVAVVFPPPSAGDIGAAPDAKPLPSPPSTDSADHRTAYVLGATAAAALAIVAAGMWAMRRRRRIT